MKLAQQVPNRFNVFVVISDIGIIQVEPVAHLNCKFIPKVLVFHHLPAAFFIVVFNGNLFADVFLCNAKLLFNTDFNGETVGVPSCFTAHIETFHGLIPAKDILDRPGH